MGEPIFGVGGGPSPRTRAPKQRAPSAPRAAASPEVLAQAPRYGAASPEVPAQAPRCASASPEVLAQAPRCASASPEVLAQAPRCASASPEVLAQAPRYGAKVPASACRQRNRAQWDAKKGPRQRRAGEGARASRPLAGRPSRPGIPGSSATRPLRFFPQAAQFGALASLAGSRFSPFQRHLREGAGGKVIAEVPERLQPLPGREFGVRCFVALRPPEDVIGRLVEISRRWARRIGTQGVKWVSATHFHLTLEFLGNVPISSLDELKMRLRERCVGTGVLELGLSGAGCFPDFSRPKVLWIGVTGDTEGLERLATLVSEATHGFGEPRDRRPFSAHLTMARFEWLTREQIAHVKRIAERPEESDAGSWRADALLLVRSELRPGGSVYETLDRIPLERR